MSRPSFSSRPHLVTRESPTSAHFSCRIFWSRSCLILLYSFSLASLAATMMIFRLVSAALLLLTAPAAAVGDRIKVELYYESQCPGCREVLTTSFKEAFAAKDFHKMADVTLVPFGNAKESADGPPYTFTCQHGPSECRYNAIEACALSKIKCPYAAFNYINCIENYDESREPDQDYGLVLGACAALTGVADLAAEIAECSTGDEGNDLIHQNAMKTAALDPPHTYVPWIVAGGVHDDDVQDDISESLLKYVCDHYHGPDKSMDCLDLVVADTTTSTGSSAGLASAGKTKQCAYDENDFPSAQQ